MLCAALLLSACGNNLSVGDKVIVVPDYDEFRSGYIIGKVMSLRNDKVTVEIKKFKDVSSKVYFDGMEKADEEDFSKDLVFVYEEGRAVVSARKKFFKEIAKIKEAMSEVSQFEYSGVAFIQLVANLNELNKKEKKMSKKRFLKPWQKALKKVKLTEDKVALLKELAAEGRLKEWEPVVDCLEVLSIYKNKQDQLTKEELLNVKMNYTSPPYAEFESKLKELEPVYRSMPYIGERDGESSLNDFLKLVTFDVPTSISQKQTVFALLESNKKADLSDVEVVEETAKFLDKVEEVSSVVLSLKILRLKIASAYYDGYDDIIDSTQDQLDELPEKILIVRNEVARKLLQAKLVKLDTYKTSPEQLVAELQKNLESLGSSEEALEIDLNDLLDQAFAANQLAHDLKQYRWTGTWKIPVNYRRTVKKSVKLSKVSFTPYVKSNLQRVGFLGKGKVILKDKDGTNVQDFDMSLDLDSDESFHLNGNFNGSYVKCGFIDDEEIQCISKDKRSNLTLITKDRKKAIKEELKQEKKAERQELKLEAKEKKKAAIKAPEQVKMTVVKTAPKALATVSSKSSWDKVDNSSWKTQQTKPVHKAIKSEARVSRPATASSHRPSVQAKKNTGHRSGVSSADARLLDQGIRKLNALL